MKVLQLLGPSTGGIRRHVAYLTTYLRAQGHTVDLAGPAGVFADLDLAHPVVLDHVVAVPSGADPRAAWRARHQLSMLVKGYDLVHAHGLKAGWIASLVRPRPPLVISVHNLVLDDVAGRSAGLLRRLEDRLPGRADYTIAVSGPIAARFGARSGTDRMTVVPPTGPPPVVHRSASDVRAELGIEPNDDLVVTAARLHPQKGLDTLLDAAELVARLRPSLRWFVFGEGPEAESFGSTIARRALSDHVILAGSRPRVDDELAAADVVVVTSDWESGPLVLLEAVALGRPVVSTDVGLARDVLMSPVGQVVPVGDAPAVATAIVEMLTNPPDDTSQVSSSEDRMHPDALAAAVESVYRAVLAR